MHIQLKILRDFDKRVRDINNNGVEYVVEFKIDGLSVGLTYNDGVFEKGATRGNGVVGEDISQNLKTVKSIPLNINQDNEVVVRGEVYISKENFENINNHKKNKDYNYSQIQET